jgi:WD40 repeat protein
VYRGVFLYGGSGSGKSSLVNAGLIPAVEAEGFRADRIRAQPRAGEELVVERISLTDEEDSFLPSSFASDAGDSAQVVLAAEELRARLATLGEDARAHRPLLIFDQFEELVTLFEEAPEGDALEEALTCQKRIVDALVDVLQDTTLPVKLLFSFREDYLAKIRKLLDRSPELVSQSLSLTPPGSEDLPRLIRGPFEDHPGQFERELSPDLTTRLTEAILDRTGSGPINLTEVQIVCLRLWESSDPEVLLEEKGIQGLLEDYLEESLNRFPEELHYPAVALLSQMVTASGARNVVSADDLIERVRTDEADIPEERLERTLEALEKETKLVRRERRRDLDLFEISSEFLVPWIGRQRAERLKAREQARLAQELEEQRRRQRARLIQRLGLVISALFVAAVALGLLALILLLETRTERDQSASREFAARALVQLRDRDDPEASVQLAAQAARQARTTEAEEALRSALVLSRRRAVLRSGTQPLTAATFSRDGKLVVTASRDGTAQVWETATGNRVGGAIAHEAAVQAVALSPDGGLVATGSQDGTARVWDVAKRRPVGPPLRHGGAVAAVAFSPDGRLLATAGGREAKVWEIASGDPRAVLRGHTDSIYSVAFSPDSMQIVTGGADNTARLWSATSGRPLALLEHQGSVYDAFFRSTGRILTASADEGARLWDVTGKPKLVALLPAAGPVSRASFSRDGRLVLTLTLTGEARVWDRRQRSLVLRGHDGPVIDAAFSPNGRLVITGGSDETARIWDARTGRAFAVLRGHDGPVNDVEFGPDGRLALTASDDGTARIWDAAVGWSIAVMRKHDAPVYRAVFSPDSKRFVTIGFDQKARVWDTTTRDQVAAGNGHLHAAFSPDSTRIVTASADGTARVWDADSGDRLAVLRGHDGAVNAVAFSPDGRRIVTASADGTARVWDADSGDRLAVLRGHDGAVNAVAFSPDGRRIVTAGIDTTAHLWDGKNFARVATLEHGDALWGVAFSADSKLVVTVGDGKTVRVWDGRSGERVAVLLHPDPVTSAVFSPDGRVVATASSDGRGRVWDAVTGVLLSELRGHSQSVNTVDFSRDGRLVLTASTDETARLFACEACRPLKDLLRLGNWTSAELGEEPRVLIRLLAAQAGDR